MHGSGPLSSEVGNVVLKAGREQAFGGLSISPFDMPRCTNTRHSHQSMASTTHHTDHVMSTVHGFSKMQCTVELDGLLMGLQGHGAGQVQKGCQPGRCEVLLQEY